MKDMRKNTDKNKLFFRPEIISFVVSFILMAIICIVLVSHYKNKAEKSILQANIQTVRAMAISEILRNWDFYGNVDGQQSRSWLVDAAITKSGTITIVDISPSTNTASVNDGIISKEEITYTQKITDMVIGEAQVAKN